DTITRSRADPHKRSTDQAEPAPEFGGGPVGGSGETCRTEGASGIRARICRTNSFVLVRKRQPKKVQMAPPIPRMSSAQKNSTSVNSGKDVLRRVARTVTSADSKHRPMVSKSENGAPCSNFSSSCSEIV